MPHPGADFPFAYRLPTDVALQIRDTAPPLVTIGSPRRRLVVLVLTIVALAGGMAAALPSGPAQAMVKHDCLYNPNWESVEYTADPANCW
jgi:hypothetical protein